MTTAKEALNEPLKEYKGPDGFYGQDGLIKQSGRALIERAVQAEPAYQLGYEKSKAGGKETENRLNGAPIKTLRTDQGPAGIDVPRGRRQRRNTRGNGAGSTAESFRCTGPGFQQRRIQENLKEIYNADVPPELTSRAAGEAKGLAGERRNRPLEPFTRQYSSARCGQASAAEGV